jgi:arsenate reductase-like glutaredoxin family protein
LRIYGLKNCDTCRAAAKALGADLVDIRAEPLDAGRIAAFHAAFGEALVNRRSTTWRGLSEADRGLPEPALIAAHPSVMKRPVIEAEDGTLHLGWTPQVRADLGVA